VIYTDHSRAIFPRINRRRNTVWLVSVRLSYSPNFIYIYAGFVLCLREDKYQEWYLASTFTQYPCYFVLWGSLKDNVYNSIPRTEELKENIRRKFVNISAEQLQRVNQKFLRRSDECLRVEGQHFQHLLLSVNCNYFILNVIV
jgi:hypothetical protein